MTKEVNLSNSAEPAARIGVMQVVDTLDAGGAERMAVNLVNHLPRRQYRVYLCTTRREGILEEAVAPDVGRLRLNRQGRFDLKAIWRLAQFVAEHDIRLLHAHNTSLFISLAAALVSPRPSVIWHHHTGRFALEDRRGTLYRLLARRIGGTIVVNQELAEWTQRRLRIPARRVWYIPNFVSRAPSQDAPLELPGAPGSRIVCVANLHADKDHPSLLEAMAQVVRRRPDAHLLLVGEARSAQYGEMLRQQVARLNLLPHVSLLGQRSDVPHILAGCDIGVLSSVSEGLPMALIEYGMAGLPVVATRIGQCPDVLDNGGAGLLTSPACPEELANALLSLLASADRRRDLGEEFRRRVSQRYSPEAVIAEVGRMYDMVLNPPH